jgi:competence protein ComEA
VTAARALLAAAALLSAAPALAEKKPLGTGERIDLNRASASELMRLPGVGKKRAQAILAYRARQPFRRPEDLLAVKGISADWLERVKGHLSASEPSRASTPVAKPAGISKK